MSKRIGVHLGTAGGASNAVERAKEIGANTLQIFSSSPRMWRAPKIDPAQAERMRALRAKYDVGPLVIHTSYLVNVCSQTADIREKSVAAFRGEIERALTLGAEFLVLHPGSWKGMTRNEGLKLAAESIAKAVDGLPWQGTDFSILIENTAGAECSLGGNFEQVAELVLRLKTHAPVGVCLDTCHTHVSGYDIVTRRRLRRDDHAGRYHVWRGCSESVALQRRQGAARIEAGPARTYRAGKYWRGAVSVAAERSAVCGLCVYCGDTRTMIRATRSGM